MKKIILSIIICLSTATFSMADEYSEPQNLNNELTTASGYSAASSSYSVDNVSYQHSQQVSECRNTENQAERSGRSEADASTAYYECLKQMVSN